MKTWMLGALLMSTTAAAVTPVPPHESKVLEWRAKRLENLKKPDGWLSLVGLHWIEPGTHTLGSAGDNAIVLAAGPAHLGSITLEERLVSFDRADVAGVSINSGPATGVVRLQPDTSGDPTVIGFDGEQGSVQVIERGGKFALRVRDARAATRTQFTRLDYYPIDETWRFDARFEAHPDGRTIDIANVINQLEPMKNPGVVIFERDGKEYRLEAVDEGDGRLFLIFADRTNGRETYGAGRFLYADAPQQGRTVVDFNLAYNPPCAFNAYSTCPLPPPENRLDLTIAAGEKKYEGAVH